MSDGMLKKYYQFELGQVCSRLSSGYCPKFCETHL